jgi:tetratricopeptide (TPR) repeat protein
MRRALVVLLTLVAGLTAAPAGVEQARKLYWRTEYQAALKLLNSVPDRDRDAGTFVLMGQCMYMQGDPKAASDLFQKAVTLTPSDSHAHLWLGRAYGRRAETSSFITAPGYASKAREHFEKAVALDGNNLEALSDLFEYYLDAPGFLGGGLDKAAALAQRMGQLNPAEYHWTQARLAEKRKEYQTAEQQLRSAAELAPRQVGRVIDLAKFLAKVGRFQESDEAFRKAAAIAPDSPKVLFERASTLIRAGRNIPEARQLLRQYLQAQLTPDDPPRQEAEQLLKQTSGA